MNTVVDGIIGRCVGGDFDIRALIAAGGVGSVYEATQRSTGKSRAIKLMHAWLASDEKMRSRFVDEARVAGSVESDHVVEVVSAGIDAELGVPWIAMELLRGETLAEYGERVGPLSHAEALEVLTQARHGLQLAHSRSLVHRDLKPENIFVADARRLGVPFTIKVLDFGIAKWVQDVREGDKNSQAIGTPSWMAPEQLSNAALITPSTDVWAIGLLAFWMLTGREYWLAANDGSGSVSAVLVELLAGARAPASSRAAELGATVTLPAGFDEWFARCIDVDPRNRYVDAGSSVDALAPLLRGDGAPSAALERAVRQAIPNTRDLDAAFDGLARDGAEPFARAHAPTATIDPPAQRPAPLRTARRLEPGEAERGLWAGSDDARSFTALAELLGEGLSAPDARLAIRQATGEVSAPSAPASAGPIPDRVQEAARHASLVLGVQPSPSLVRTGGDARGFTIEEHTPVTLGVSAALLDELDDARLRAHAAVAVGRALPAFVVHGLLGSPEALEAAHKAAVALAKGAVSQSPFFRPLVSHLGPRRGELASACDRAAGSSAASYWRGVELTLARLALLCAGEVDAAVHAATVASSSVSPQELRAELEGFARAPGFDGYFRS